MTAILKSEMYKYFPEELTRQRIKYGNQTIDIDYRMGNGLYLPKQGKALYLPKKYTKDGEGIGEIVGWIAKNGPVIKDILGVAAPAINLVGNTAQTIGTTVDTIKKIRDINKSSGKGLEEKMSGISSRALENILNSKTASSKKVKEGKGFYFLSPNK